MKISLRYSISELLCAASALSTMALQSVACSDNRGKLADPGNPGGETGGSTETSATTGGSSTDGAGSIAGGGTDTGTTSGTSTGGSATGSSNTGGSDADVGGMSGDGRDGGIDADNGRDATVDDGDTVEPFCVFHNSAPPLPEGGLGGGTNDAATSDGNALDGGGVADGDAGDGAHGADGTAPTDGRASGTGGGADAGVGEASAAGPTIAIQVNAFIGRYLSDAAGRTLYTYGGDLPGDCTSPPVTTCDKDCAIAWPPFEGLPRTLAPTLDDQVFGTIQRADGGYQATYYGWPLYYFKTDTAGALGGQAKAKTWFAATVIPPTVVIMKSATAQKYLGDGSGMTLYTFAKDTSGTGSSDPVSACTGACLDNYRPFQKNRISVVSSLEPTDFSIFIRSDGTGQHVAYKGAPLYYATADHRPGDVNGLASQDWAVVPQ